MTPTQYPALPTGWTLEPVSEVGRVQLGRQRAPVHERGRHMMPYLRVANVYDGWIDYSDVLVMNFSPGEQETFGLVPGDILLNEGQSLELVGRSAIYREAPGAYCFQNTLVRFRAGDRAIPEYCQSVFQRWLGLGRFQVIAKQTTSIAHLGASRFAKMLLPLPPRPQQRAIAHVLALVDDVITDTEAAIAKLVAIREGLLHHLLTRGLGENGELAESTADILTTRLGDSLIEPPRNGYSPEAADEFTGTYMLGLGCLSDRGFMPSQLKLSLL